MAAHENMSYRAQDISYRFFNLIVELVDLENLHVDTFFMIIGQKMMKLIIIAKNCGYCKYCEMLLDEICRAEIVKLVPEGT